MHSNPVAASEDQEAMGAFSGTAKASATGDPTSQVHVESTDIQNASQGTRPNSAGIDIFVDRKKVLGESLAAVDTSASDSSDDSINYDDYDDENFSALDIAADRINSWVDAVDDAFSIGMESLGNSIGIREDVNIIVETYDSAVPLPMPNGSKDLEEKQTEYFPCVEAVHREASEIPSKKQKSFSCSLFEIPDASKDSTAGKTSQLSCCYEMICFRGDLEEHDPSAAVIKNVYPKEQSFESPASTLDQSELDRGKSRARVQFATGEQIPVWARLDWRVEAPPRPKAHRGILRNGGSSLNRVAELSEQVTSIEPAPIVMDEEKGAPSLLEAQEIDFKPPLDLEENSTASQTDHSQVKTGVERNHHEEELNCDVDESSALPAAEPRMEHTKANHKQEELVSSAEKRKSTTKGRSGKSLFRALLSKSRRFLFPKSRGSLFVKRETSPMKGETSSISLLGSGHREPRKSSIPGDVIADPIKPIYSDECNCGLRLTLLERFESVLKQPDSAQDCSMILSTKTNNLRSPSANAILELEPYAV